MNKNNAQNAAASPRLASAAQRRLGWLLVGGFVALLMYPNLYLLGEPWNWALPGHKIIGSGRVHVLFVNLLLVAMLVAAVRRAWIAIAVLSPFMTLLPLELFYMSQFGTPTHAALLGVISDTDRTEAMSWLGTTGVIVLGLAALALLASWALAAWLRPVSYTHLRAHET
mgnify:FL=1